LIKCLATTTDNEDNIDWDLKLMEVQWSLNNSESYNQVKPFSVVHNYKAEGLVNNPLSTEIIRINEINNTKTTESKPAETLR